MWRYSVFWEKWLCCSGIKSSAGRWPGEWLSARIDDAKFFVLDIKQDSLLIGNNFKFGKEREKGEAGMETSQNWLTTANLMLSPVYKECVLTNAGAVTPVVGGSRNSVPTIPIPEQKSQNNSEYTRQGLRNSTR